MRGGEPCLILVKRLWQSIVTGVQTPEKRLKKSQAVVDRVLSIVEAETGGVLQATF